MLTLRAHAELAGEIDSPTALDYVEAWLSNGDTFIDLASSLQDQSKLEAAGPFEPVLQGGAIGRMLRRTFGEPQCDAVLVRARARGAHANVEKTYVIADEVVTSSEDAARARNRIGTRQWSAERYERGLQGKAGVAVNINLGAAHIDAMRHRVIPQPAAVRLADQQIETVEAEVIDELSALPATT